MAQEIERLQHQLTAAQAALAAARSQLDLQDGSNQEGLLEEMEALRQQVRAGAVACRGLWQLTWCQSAPWSQRCLRVPLEAPVPKRLCCVSPGSSRE